MLLLAAKGGDSSHAVFPGAVQVLPAPIILPLLGAILISLLDWVLLLQRDFFCYLRSLC